MNYSSQEILDIAKAELLNKSLIINEIRAVEYDTRKIFDGSKALFIAFTGNTTDGHKYIAGAYKKGVRNFIITKSDLDYSVFKEANFFKVESAYNAIQKIAAHHRNKFDIKVISITGSNGKTIVKEWLAQCLSRTRKVIKSPVSFNSQLGVALSLLLIEKSHEFAIIEAGISTLNEMQKLAEIIRPEIGVLTNIGDAHSVGFKNLQEKLDEKLKLFAQSDKIVTSYDQAEIHKAIKRDYRAKKILSWSSENQDAFYKVNFEKQSDHTLIVITVDQAQHELKVPFTDDASLENIMQVITVLLELEIDILEIQSSIFSLDNLPMRLELKEGINNCLVLDDSYSFDIESLKIGIKELSNNANDRDKSIIISDLDNQNSSDESYYKIAKILEQLQLKRLIIIGNQLSKVISKTSPKTKFHSYHDVESLIDDLTKINFENEIVLIKGARRFCLDKISSRINARQNKTVLEIDLFALSENIDFYRKSIPKGTGLMAVLKASAYGSGSQQLSSVINNKNIDILAVAIIEEAIEMRKSGISKPILIFNPHADSLNLISEYDFEIELSNKTMAEALLSFVNAANTKIKIQLKLDTGMNRLGFKKKDFSYLDSVFQNENIFIKAIFSHLAASDDPSEDSFTKQQIKLFDDWYEELTAHDDLKPLKHILNSSGCLRFPSAQYDFVRIGLGLYGMDLANSSNGRLTKVHSLKSFIVQIKEVGAGETVGYGNKLKLKKAARIAIIGIGYADGLMRKAGVKTYPVVIKGQKAPLIGNVCMDLCMVDISELEGVKEGDEVLIFGKNHPIEGLSEACETIPYEILTRIAPRVKRVYIQ